MDVPGAAAIIPHSIVRALIAVAEQAEERNSKIALETLCELGKLNLNDFDLSHPKS